MKQIYRGKKPGGQQSPSAGNGSGPPQAPLVPWLEGLATQSNFPSVIKEFVHAGNDPRELLMRTYFTNERKANQAARLLMKFDRFKMDDRFPTLVLNKLAANCSIAGMSRMELLQASAGVVVADYVRGRRTNGGRVQREIEKQRKKEEEEEEE